MRRIADSAGQESLGLMGAVALAVLAGACGGTPTTPTHEAPSASARSVPAGLYLVAPSSLAPGSTARLRLVHVEFTGRSADVTARAQFDGGPPDLVRVSSDGTVSALAVGDAMVNATYDHRHVTQPLVVVPDGTYRVIGTVVEAGGGDVPVAGVQVEAEGGPVAATDLDGRYRLFGVAAGSRLRFSKRGYVTTTAVAEVAAHHAVDVALAVDGPRLDHTGRYQLTIDAAPECRGRLPDPLLTRRYAAAVTQLGRELRVVLTGARFVSLNGAGVNAQWVTGRVDETGTAVELSLLNYGHCDYTEVLVEQVDTGYLQIDGAIRLRPDGAGLAGALVGELLLYQNPQCQVTPIVPLGVCKASSHRVTLTR